MATQIATSTFAQPVVRAGSRCLIKLGGGNLLVVYHDGANGLKSREASSEANLASATAVSIVATTDTNDPASYCLWSDGVLLTMVGSTVGASSYQTYATGAWTAHAQPGTTGNFSITSGFKSGSNFYFTSWGNFTAEFDVHYATTFGGTWTSLGQNNVANSGGIDNRGLVTLPWNSKILVLGLDSGLSLQWFAKDTLAGVSGGNFQAATSIETVTGGTYLNNLAGVTDSNGNAWMAYNDTTGIQLRMLTAAGTSWTAKTAVTAQASDTFPALFQDTAGNVWVFWVDGSSGAIKGQKATVSGSSISLTGSAQTVTTPTATPSYLSVIESDASNAYLVWTQGAASPFSIYVHTFSVSGGGGATAWSKAVSDTHSALDIRLSQAGKQPREFLSALDGLTKAYTSSQSEKFSSLDAALKAAQHRLAGDATSATDSVQRARGAVQALFDAFSERETATRTAGKGLGEGISALDTQSNRAGKVVGDSASSLDSLQRAPAHLVSGDATSATDTMARARGSVWTLVDVVSSRDSITQHAVSKLLGETFASLDTTRFATTHQLVETLVLIDVLSKLPSHLLSDIVSSTDSLAATKNAGAVAWSKTLTETQSAQDLRLAAVLKLLGETQSAQDTRTALVLKTLGENLVLVDRSSWNTVHRLVDSLSATDKFVAGRALLLALQEWFSSTEVSSEVKQQALAKGHLAVLSLTISTLLGVHLAISTSTSLSAVLGALRLAIHATLALG